MQQNLLTRLFFVLAFTATSSGMPAQWTLKHASSVIVSTYLPCHSVINNKVYLVGTPNGSTNYVYEYDPVLNSYTQKVLTTILGFNDQVSFTLNNQMFLVGFSNQNSYAYDPPTDNWLTKDPSGSLGQILMGLYSPASYGFVFNGSLFAFALNNKAYIGGLTVVDLNTNMQSISPYVFVYDPVTDNYSVLTVPAIMTSYNILTAASFELNGKGYVVGTVPDPATPGGAPGVYEFDPSTSSFTSKNSCSCGVMGYSSFVLNNLAYVNVIQNCSDYTPVYTFDPVANTWAPSDTVFLPDTADLRLAYAVNGKGYLGYGINYNSACGINGNHSQLYEYAPEGLSVAAQESPALNVSVFPNPATNRLTLHFNFPAAERTSFILAGPLGNEVYRGTTIKGEEKFFIDVSAWADGMYFLFTTDGKVREKVIVKK